MTARPAFQFSSPRLPEIPLPPISTFPGCGRATAIDPLALSGILTAVGSDPGIAVPNRESGDADASVRSDVRAAAQGWLHTHRAAGCHRDHRAADQPSAACAGLSAGACPGDQGAGADPPPDGRVSLLPQQLQGSAPP